MGTVRDMVGQWSVKVLLWSALLWVFFVGLSKRLEEFAMAPATEAPAAEWVPVVNPFKPDVGGFAPAMYRAELDGMTCFVVVNTFDDSLSCVASMPTPEEVGPDAVVPSTR